jgi:mercuric ion transport protein
MTIKPRAATKRIQRGQALIVAGGILGAVAASSCCVLPLLLFGLGVGGAWIAHLTRLAPYQPCFIMVTTVFLAGGYWSVYRSTRSTCADGAGCARPLPSRIVKAGLIAATALVLAALGLDIVAPLLLGS